MYFDCQMSSVEDREQKCIGASKCSLLLSLLSRCVCLDLVPDVMNRMCRRRTASIYFPSLLLVRTCPRLASSKVAPPQSKYGSVASFYTYLPLEACCFFFSRPGFVENKACAATEKCSNKSLVSFRPCFSLISSSFAGFL